MRRGWIFICNLYCTVCTEIWGVNIERPIIIIYIIKFCLFFPPFSHMAICSFHIWHWKHYFLYFNRKNHLRLPFSLQMNSFESLKYDETSVKSVAGPRSPESNIPNVREALLEETNPKRLYERAPPEGSEIRHDISYHPVYDNKPSKTEKVMKDKDLYVSFQEGKKDNIVQSLNYASECSLHNFDIRFKLGALSKYTCTKE